MSGHKKHDHPVSGHQPSAADGYERTDAAAMPVVAFTFWLAVFTVASFAACFAMYRWMEHGRKSMDPASHPMAVERKISQNVPRLQIHEAADLAVFRQTADEQVNSYGWISREASMVRVPVAKAMDLLLKNKELKSRE